MKHVELTEREKEVIDLVAAARTNREIAHELGITERTVEFHLGNVYKKLGFASKIQVAVWAANTGGKGNQNHQKESVRRDG
ncbi:MAG: helix-turn-helix transcriptional regulator [Chloroflexota bacterium]